MSAASFGRSRSRSSWNTTNVTVSARDRRIMIRKLKSGRYRLYSQSRDPKTGEHQNLGTFETRVQAEQHEREVQFFKRRGHRGRS
jgi:hypothetical protein